MSFTLREFPPKPPVDLWFTFPLHTVDHTELLADCKPNYGGVSEARKLRTEAENLGKVSSLDAVCDKLIGDGESCFRDDVQAALGWSQPTVNRWLDQSRRFMRSIDKATTRASVVRRPAEGAAVNDAATSDLDGGDAEQEEVVQGALDLDS